MRLSTSTNIMDRYQKKQGSVSMEECIRQCYEAGYRVLDMNCHDMSNPGMPIFQDDWESWAYHIRDLADSLGIEFSQSHSHFYHFLNKNVENRELHEELTRRSVIVSAILGVKWMTVHAATEVDTRGYSHRLSKQGNMEYFPKYIEMAKKMNIGITLENMFDPTPLQRTYTAAVEDLLDLTDSFNDPQVQICWDFGHGNLVGYDQCEAVRCVGSRLKSVHIADNHGVKDEHLLPFYGSIDWPRVMRTLREINYQGDFTYEITPFLDAVPCEIRQSALVHTVDVGRYLIGLY